MDYWRSPVTGIGILRLRIGLGLIVSLSALRLLAYGWVTTLYTAPPYHFSYRSFEWVQALPAPWMPVLVVVLFVLGFAVASGIGGRLVVLLCGAVFTYIEILDKAIYLNHYYLISLLLLHLALSSAPGLPLRRSVWVPRYELWAVRAQVAIVYFFAGVWKLNGDWMWRAEPLSTWLWGFQGTPMFGSLLVHPWTAFAMSWAGAIFDLTIWVFLLWRRTSKVAYLVCIGFHFILWLMFPIGVFAWVMILAASVLLPQSQSTEETRPHRRSASRIQMMLALVLALLISLQLLIPLRSLLEGGNVNWHERGYRFSWRVMLNEKAASVDMRVRRQGGWQSWPYRDELSPLQRRQMGFQPDMLLQYAHSVCAKMRNEGEVADVRVDARVAWNSRRAAPLIADLNLCDVDESSQVILQPPR